MTITAASNIFSLRAQTNLARTTAQLGKTIERLSSGLRINSASDDPAGLALADKLGADARIASVALRNANDGVSVISIADAALDEIGSILTRMAELAAQSANGSYTNEQRSAISSEFVALGSEIERIAVTTTFNDIKLLSSSSTITLQVGTDSTANSQIAISGIFATLNSLGLAGAGSSALSYSLLGTTTEFAQSASLQALSAVNGAIDSLSVKRGSLGASESRLESAINYLQVAQENFLAAESRIRDADVAQETAELVRLQILQQAGVAVLAQANQQPQLVIELLQ